MTKKELLKRIKKNLPNTGKPTKQFNENDCLDCYEVYQNIKTLKDITAHTFPVSCDLSLSNLSDDVFLYMLPRLLQLVINQEENNYDDFIPQVLDNLVNEKRFSFYSRDKIQVIILFLEFIKPTYHKENYETWCFETEQMISYHYEKRCFDSITNALIFWNKKLKNRKNS